MVKRKQSRRTKSPISLENLEPRKDVRGSGHKNIFGILARDVKQKNLSEKKD